MIPLQLDGFHLVPRLKISIGYHFVIPLKDQILLWIFDDTYGIQYS
jgi:hypothetical protein